MDDLSVLDLLACPVCAGRLDASARVLPCQHTFCQPCLQKAVNSRKELRCPECRTPAYCNSVEELPANLLLVRLLEGIRGEQAIVRANSLRRAGGPPLKGSPRRSRELQGVLPGHYRLIQSGRIPVEGVPCAKALCSYRGNPPNELRFNKGDMVLLQRQLDENWYQGSVNGIVGILPASAVQVMKQLPPPPPLCRALYNFELKDKDKGENKHCLAFLKDDIISVIRRVDDNWAEGMLGDRVGIFPLLFVESNITAKQILEQSKASRPGLQSSTSSPLRKPSLREKAMESAMYNKIPDAARSKGPRQFLITNALNTINKMVHSPADQRSVEISTPVLISSSNPAVLSESYEKADSVSSAPLQVNTSCSAPLQSLGHLTTVTAFLNSQQHISANMCVALHPYKARGPDEIDLQKGEGVRVLGPFHEGWLKGMSLVTGKSGVFPSSYVIPVFRKAPHLMESRSLPLTPGTFSSVSLSSMGSASENTAGKYRRSVYVPTAVVAPVRSSVGPALSAQMSLRRGRSSVKKSSSLPRYSGSLFQGDSSLRRTPSAIVRPQQFQNFQNLTESVGSPPASADTGGVRLNSPHDFAILVGRGTEHRTHSADSSLILDAKVTPVKNGTLLKPPGSAPPSILVKPETSKNNSEKQVKTVRFQNYSPPPSKRHSSISSPNAENGRPEQAVMESPKQEAAQGPEMTGIYHHQRANSAPVQQMENRRSHATRTLSLDLSALPAPVNFPSKASFNDN
ncbi:E3 ubiquitin-protein ligase SH3RF2 isoform X2 [Ambystoma mexicanum]|uniref:E3 ubiquitin-protein ligase SH3RF2 isoform X2 n=1 Tax=Ambystoma mexicanum TaxID=8296 RepID=UPI0037E8E523